MTFHLQFGQHRCLGGTPAAGCAPVSVLCLHWWAVGGGSTVASVGVCVCVGGVRQEVEKNWRGRGEKRDRELCVSFQPTCATTAFTAAVFSQPGLSVASFLRRDVTGDFSPWQSTFPTNVSLPPAPTTPYRTRTGPTGAGLMLQRLSYPACKLCKHLGSSQVSRAPQIPPCSRRRRHRRAHSSFRFVAH